MVVLPVIIPPVGAAAPTTPVPATLAVGCGRIDSMACEPVGTIGRMLTVPSGPPNVVHDVWFALPPPYSARMFAAPKLCRVASQACAAVRSLSSVTQTAESQRSSVALLLLLLLPEQAAVATSVWV